MHPFWSHLQILMLLGHHMICHLIHSIYEGSTLKISSIREVLPILAQLVLEWLQAHGLTSEHESQSFVAHLYVRDVGVREVLCRSWHFYIMAATHPQAEMTPALPCKWQTWEYLCDAFQDLGVLLISSLRKSTPLARITCLDGQTCVMLCVSLGRVKQACTDGWLY